VVIYVVAIQFRRSENRRFTKQQYRAYTLERLWSVLSNQQLSLDLRSHHMSRFGDTCRCYSVTEFLQAYSENHSYSTPLRHRGGYVTGYATDWKDLSDLHQHIQTSHEHWTVTDLSPTVCGCTCQQQEHVLFCLLQNLYWPTHLRQLRSRLSTVATNHSSVNSH